MANEPIIYTVHVEALMIDNKFVVLFLFRSISFSTPRPIRVHNGNADFSARVSVFLSLSPLSLSLSLSLPRRWTHIFLSIVYEYRGDCKWPGFSGPHSVFMVDVCICEWVCSLDYVHIFQWYDRCGDCYSMAMFQNTVLTKNTDVLVYSSLSALCASILGLCVRLLNDEIRKFLMV